MKNSSFARRARRGFTLVELLVVIGVIALLAGIAFPVFSRAREGGRRTVCQSNLKQLGLAFAQYMNDKGRYPGAASFRKWGDGGHWVAGTNLQNLADLSAPHDVFPANCDDTNTCNKAQIENGALFPYIRSTAVFVCPSNRDAEFKKLTYSMNCALQYMGEARIKAPAEIVLLVDEEKANDGFFFAVDDENKYPNKLIVPGAESTDKLSEIHNGGSNLLFVDGHAKFFPFKTFVLDDSPVGLTNKGKTDGNPRFHDKAFGTYGSYSVPGVTSDACGVKLVP